ncbi:hypothetical protein D3C86_1882130 [compost metagenome]
MLSFSQTSVAKVRNPFCTVSAGGFDDFEISLDSVRIDFREACLTLVTLATAQEKIPDPQPHPFQKRHLKISITRDYQRILVSPNRTNRADVTRNRFRKGRF